MKNVASSKHSTVFDAQIEELKARSDWRGDMLQRIRGLIREAEPEMMEEQKWAKATNPGGVPVFSHNGIVCTLETYKSAVKLTFAKGASLRDSAGLFNSSLAGNARRAIDIREEDRIDERALKQLVREAVKLNLQGKAE